MTFWDSLIVGEAREMGSHTFLAEDIKRFAAKCDPQAFHLDEDAAKASVLGGLCASGWHTAGVCMRLNVESQVALGQAWVAAGNQPPRMGPSPGVKNLAWPKPVYAGDTLSVRQQALSKRVLESRPEMGLVKNRFEVLNQHDEVVCDIASNGLFARREAEDASA